MAKRQHLKRRDLLSELQTLLKSSLHVSVFNCCLFIPPSERFSPLTEPPVFYANTFLHYKFYFRNSVFTSAVSPPSNHLTPPGTSRMSAACIQRWSSTRWSSTNPRGLIWSCSTCPAPQRTGEETKIVSLSKSNSLVKLSAPQSKEKALKRDPFMEIQTRSHLHTMKWPPAVSGPQPLGSRPVPVRGTVGTGPRRKNHDLPLFCFICNLIMKEVLFG